MGRASAVRGRRRDANENTPYMPVRERVNDRVITIKVGNTVTINDRYPRSRRH